mmetsp:Transcript_7772/g.19032  ORF Transcript_7772/g.19032 Transcript_7772/m.19032 type:complete len:611 (-) Transcript_7772:419-2251(-)
MTLETKRMLIGLARASGLEERIQAMARGEAVNPTEGRAALHMALRADPTDSFLLPSGADGVDVVPLVHEVLSHVEDFSERVRSGAFRGHTGRRLLNVLVVGIGGSYLGADFVATALAHDPEAEAAAAEGVGDGRRRELRFLANVDPVDAHACVRGWDPEETLVVVISKTFTTAETLLNARTVRSWLVGRMGEGAVRDHMVAVSADAERAESFGVAPGNVFGFWDWVGGRYSVSSAAGVLPLALQFGMPVARAFLAGARDVDRHFLTTPLDANLPVLLGLLAVWQSSFQGYGTRALVAYSRALAKLAPHVQQLAMESNGKRVAADGTPLPRAEASEVVEFGEPGTNAQHSFFQLLHQGRAVPVDFVGFARSQAPVRLPGEAVANHDELMANFFAQPDALAVGITAAQLRAQGVPEALVPHRLMPGDRPSTVLLFDRAVDAFATGQLLALYEHRVAVQGFIWGVNSFDQFGVELGKQLARRVREQLAASRAAGRGGEGAVEGFNPSTERLLKRYLRASSQKASAAGPGSGSGSSLPSDSPSLKESGAGRSAHEEHGGPALEEKRRAGEPSPHPHHHRADHHEGFPATPERDIPIRTFLESTAARVDPRPGDQ